MGALNGNIIYVAHIIIIIMHVRVPVICVDAYSFTSAVCTL